MGAIEITLGLLLAVALVGAAGKLPVPLPILQVGAGMRLATAQAAAPVAG